MNINELDNFRLADAVKFNNDLNPRLWQHEQLRPEAREKMLAIANDFREFLGISDLDVKDITISGSNAAYTYTDHSDIDLHLVVDLPQHAIDEVYRELFDAKKYQYNDEHDYRIGGADVELYVQLADQPHVSQGIYSIVDDTWIKVPSRRNHSIDDMSVRSKYEDLTNRIDQAIESGDLGRLEQMSNKISTMRKSGLAATGEFGTENITFKLLRARGDLDRLRQARLAAKDQEFSLAEAERNKNKKPQRYGYQTYWFPGYDYYAQSADIDPGLLDAVGGESQTNESLDSQDPEPKDIKEILRPFIKSCIKYLEIEKIPNIILKRDPEWTRQNGTFGHYDPDTHSITLAVSGRHPLDILRTLAHELTHAHQNELVTMPMDAGATGSAHEDDANAQAGRIMRHWADQHPEYFKDVQLEDYDPKAPGSGADNNVIGHMAKNLTGLGSPIAKIRHKRDTEREKLGSISYGYRQDPNLKTTHKQVPFGEQGVAEGSLNEGLAHPIIVVDVQPEYSGMNDGDESSVFPQIINFVNKQTGPVLMFVNAEDQGMSGDTIQDIKQYWDDTICPEEERYTHDEETDDYIENPNCPKINWQRFAIADKGYGYFRSWMDHGIEPATIIATIRELYQQKKNDSRELQFPAFNRRTPQQSLIMGAMQEMEDDPISVNWTSLAQLKRFNGAYIVGGARDQCLREVELLMNAFNIKYKRIDSLIYEGQQGVAEGQDDKAEAYRAHLIKTLPQIMKLFANIGKGWIPSKEQMLSAVDTAYTVMKHTGDAKQAGKVLMDELNTLYRMSQGKQGVAEGSDRIAVKKQDRLDALENKLKAKGYVRTKDSDGGEYQYRWTRDGAPTYVVNYRFGSNGYEKFWKEQGVAESTGYIPVNNKEAQDPRYSMAITQDIKPGEPQRQAAKMGWKVDKAGVPPLLMTKLQNQLQEIKIK